MIYRVEHKDYGHGPFRPGWTPNKSLCDVSDLVCDETDDEFFFPSPCNDGLNRSRRKYPDDWYYGVTDLEQIKHWFSDNACNAMHEVGYVIAVYRARFYKIGNSRLQVEFDKTKAELKETLAL